MKQTGIVSFVSDLLILRNTSLNMLDELLTKC